MKTEQIKSKAFEVIREFDNYKKSLTSDQWNKLREGIHYGFRSSTAFGKVIEDHSEGFAIYNKFLAIIKNLYSYQDPKTKLYPIAIKAFDITKGLDEENWHHDPEKDMTNHDFIMIRTGLFLI